MNHHKNAEAVESVSGTKAKSIKVNQDKLADDPYDTAQPRSKTVNIMLSADSALTHMSHDKNAQENKPIKEGFVEEGDDSRSQMIKDKTVVFDEEEEDGTV